MNVDIYEWPLQNLYIYNTFGVLFFSLIILILSISLVNSDTGCPVVFTFESFLPELPMNFSSLPLKLFSVRKFYWFIFSPFSVIG